MSRTYSSGQGPSDADRSDASTRYGSSAFGEASAVSQPSADHPDNVGSRDTGAYGQKQEAEQQAIACQSIDSQSTDCGGESGAAQGFSGRFAGTADGQAPTPDMLRAHAKTAKRHVEAAASEVKSVAHEAANATRQIRDKAATVADYQRTRTADVFDIISDAVRDAGKRLLEEPRTREVGIWGDIAADKVTGASRYLRQNDAGTMFRDANQVARKHPELFLGAMATAGLALARFIKASQRHETERLLSQAREHTGDSGSGATNSSFGADSASESRYTPTGYTAADRGDTDDRSGAGSEEWNSAGGRISDVYRPISSARGDDRDDALLTDPTPLSPDTKPRLSQTQEEI